jgi:hypothetical protein
MKQQGFILPGILILLALASLVATHALRLASLTDTNYLQAQLASQGFYAAEAGLSWSMASIDLSPTTDCHSPTTISGEEVLAPGFSIAVSCEQTQHTDSGRNFNIFYIRSEATYEQPGHRHFSSRLLELTYLR